ncbi:hypothetical protein [Antarcticirhabdus aurantiaca]|uniref:Uncharacterized protein n=1 Tax=Antarcticirhabdus aurantiaca TaxID=2606717 RepID=A0ACD4NJ88_9HYPH|nr:hypothetical protein OXU80_18445 [Jeongeuplla avenae]
MHVSRLAGALALACLLAAAPTFAHAAEVDLTPIASYGLDILFGVLATVAVGAFGILAALIRKKTGIDLAILQTRDNATLHAGIARVVEAIEASARERLFGPDGRVTVDVGNPMVAEAANKLAARSPDLLKRIGVDEATLRELVAERINSSGYIYGSLVAGEALSALASFEIETLKPAVDTGAIDAAIEKVDRLGQALRSLPPLPLTASELPDPEEQTARLVRQAPPLPAGVAAGLPGV